MIILAAAFSLAASASAQDILFNLNKRTDLMRFQPVGDTYRLVDERLSNDKMTTPIAWKVTGLKWKEGSKNGPFTVVKSGEGSEVRLDIAHLPARYVPSIGNVGSNSGIMTMTISGHGPAFEKLRRDILACRFGEAWNGDSDLVFHGDVLNGH